MNLNELKAAGAIVPALPVKRHIVRNREGLETVEFDVHIRRLAFGPLERLMLDDTDDRSRSAAYLSATVLLGDDGGEPLTYDDAYQLDPSLAAALLRAARQVNSNGDQPEKN